MCNAKSAPSRMPVLCSSMRATGWLPPGIRLYERAGRLSGPFTGTLMRPPASQASAGQPVSADRGALLSTIVNLWPYIWPSDRSDLKLRVLGAMLLLVAAKLATIAVPFTFKWATDALAGQGSASSDWLVWAIAAPVMMTVAY